MRERTWCPDHGDTYMADDANALEAVVEAAEMLYAAMDEHYPVDSDWDRLRDALAAVRPNARSQH